MLKLYDIIGYPFGFLMSLIYGLFDNYAVAIIIFTVVTKLLLLPVNYSTQKNAARMQLLNPKLEKLKKSFANNPQRLQQEQQKLYQQEGLNPMGSCLPAFIQMFLLFGVLDVVYKPLTHILRLSNSVKNAAFNIVGVNPSKELRCELRVMESVMNTPEKYTGSVFDGFVDTVRDFSERFTVFGANLGKTPDSSPETWTKEAIILFCIPFLAGIAQLLVSIYTQIHQKKTNPNMQGGGCMAVMFYVMPVISVYFAFQLPAGVGFYWIWSSLFSFVITYALNLYFTPERTEKINEKEKEKARIYAEKHPNKKTFMQRMLEQQAALEEQQNSAKKSSSGEKMSRSEANKANRDKIREARRKMAEKYGDVYDENENDED